MLEIKNTQDQTKSFNEEEFNFFSLLKTINRGKKTLFTIISFVTICTLIYSYRVKSIWSGSLYIVIKEASESNNNFLSLDKDAFSFLNKSTSNKTQEYILRSPSVLMPVYEYVRDFYSKNKLNNNLSFEGWMKKELKVEFQDDSNVLLVQYKNNDKKLIIDVLKMISEKYQNYSTIDRRKNITRTINYLEEQKKIMKNQSINSLREFNKFSLKNGLGNLDGFLDPAYENNFDSINSLQDSTKIPNSNSIQKSGASQRFQSQFQSLENYESLYTDLSSKLKPNSIALIELSNKIENIKTSLERPIEILLEYRELMKIATRDEILLNSIEEKLEFFKLEKINKPDSWEIISNPTLDDSRIFPQRKRLISLSTLFSFIIGSLFIILREKYGKTIYDIEEYRNYLSLKFLDTLDFKNKKLSLRLIKKFIQEDDKNYEINVLNFSSINLTNLNEENKTSKIKFNELSINELINIDEKVKIIIFIENGIFKKDQLIKLNQYYKIYKNNLIGWFKV